MSKISDKVEALARPVQKFSIALALRTATTVSSVTSTPGNRNMRIRRCGNAPLKIDRGRIVWYNKVLEIFKAVKECSE